MLILLGAWLLCLFQLKIEYSSELRSCLIIPELYDLQFIHDLVQAILDRDFVPGAVGSSIFAEMFEEAARVAESQGYALGSGSKAGALAILGWTYRHCDIDQCFQALVQEATQTPAGPRLAMFANSNVLLAKANVLGIGSFHVPSLQKATLFTDRLAIPFRKGSPLVKYFDVMILRILSGGLFRTWKTRAYHRIGLYRYNGESIKVKDHENDWSGHDVTFNLQQLKGIFYLDLFLLTCSIAGLLREIWKKMNQNSMLFEHRKPIPRLDKVPAHGLKRK